MSAAPTDDNVTAPAKPAAAPREGSFLELRNYAVQLRAIALRLTWTMTAVRRLIKCMVNHVVSMERTASDYLLTDAGLTVADVVAHGDYLSDQ